MTNPRCWICGDEATTREHKIKKSDLHKSVFKENRPAFLSTSKLQNRIVQGPGAQSLKFKKSLCVSCNGSLTQPYDKAWQRLSLYLKTQISEETDPTKIIIADCFQASKQMKLLRYTHLYFVKWLGCMLIEANASFAQESFSDSIKLKRAHPKVFLKFGVGVYENAAGNSDMHARIRNRDNVLDDCIVIYDAGDGLSVQVAYCSSINGKINALDDSWHPRMGTNIQFFEKVI